MTTFATFARLKRIEAGLSQERCAAALNYEHRSTFLRKETGLIEWSLADLEAFAGLLGVRPSELLAEFERTEAGANDLPGSEPDSDSEVSDD